MPSITSVFLVGIRPPRTSKPNVSYIWYQKLEHKESQYFQKKNIGNKLKNILKIPLLSLQKSYLISR